MEYFNIYHDEIGTGGYVHRAIEREAGTAISSPPAVSPRAATSLLSSLNRRRAFVIGGGMMPRM